jgi:hypothetical protein
MSIVLALPVVLATTLPVGVGPAAPWTLERAWALLDGCGSSGSDEAEPVVPEGGRSYEAEFACVHAGKAVLALGDASDRDRLWDLHDALPEASVLRMLILPALLASHVEDAAAVLDGVRATVAFAPRTEEESPQRLELADASAELRSAVALAEAVRGHEWPEPSAPPGERLVYTSNEDRRRFDAAVSRILKGGAGAEEARGLLDRFEYGAGCGGWQSFELARSAARLVLALREGRVDPDAVLAYAMAATEKEQERLRRRLLAAVGIDWEALDVGLFLSAGRTELEPLVRSGSDRAARLLLELATLARRAGDDRNHEIVQTLVVPLAGFVAGNGPCADYRTVSSEDVERDPDAPAIDEGLQLAILDLLHEAVAPTAGLDEATAASHALLRACREESRPAFRAMRQSPFFELRSRGALALRALGEAVEDPVPPPGVAFRLRVDGRDWRGPVRWVLERASGEWAGGSAGGTSGVVHLDRDPFLDAAARVEAVRFEPLAPEGDTWFSARAEVPADLADTTTLAVRTGSLSVSIPSRALATDGPVRGGGLLSIETVDGEGRPEEFVLSVSPTRTLYTWRLQHGTYRASLLLPDGSQWLSPRVEVGARPEAVELVP